MIADKVKSILLLTRKKQTDLARLYGMSDQSMSNKLTQGRITAEDLIRIADFAGCRLSVTLPDGSQIYFGPEDIRKESRKR